MDDYKSKYLLRKNIHVCVTGQAAVFLDLERDTYTGLDYEQSSALSLVVQGWPKHSDVRSDEHLASELAQELCERGLLTAVPTDGWIPRLDSSRHLAHSLIDSPDLTIPKLNAYHIAVFAQAYVTALLLIKFCKPAFYLNRARKRRAERTNANMDFDRNRAKALTLSFYWIRPLFYSKKGPDGKGKCLLDSCVLIEFLAAFGLYPSWVIGVQARPYFSAHSWVQQDEYLLNGTVEFTSLFTPIYCT